MMWLRGGNDWEEATQQYTESLEQTDTRKNEATWKHPGELTKYMVTRSSSDPLTTGPLKNAQTKRATTNGNRFNFA